MGNDTGSGRTTLAWGNGHVRHSRIPEWLLDADVSDRAKILYALLATYADRGGRAFPGKKLIVARLRCSEPSYRRAVAELESVGALTRTPRHRGDGSQTSNDYLLHWSASGEDASQAIGEGVVGDAPPASPETGLTRARSSSEDLQLETELERPSSRGDESVAKPPKLSKTSDGRDLAFDALAEECGVDPKGNRAREVGIALNGSARSGLPLGIRALVAQAQRERGEDPAPGPEFEIDVVDEIRAKATRYREAMRGAMLTPLALAKWWTDVDAASTSRDPAAELLRSAADDARAGR